MSNDCYKVFGLLLIVLSIVISSPEFRSLNTIPLIISPLLYIFGNLLIILPMVVDPEYFSRHSRLIVYIFSFTLVISAIVYQMYYVFSIPVVMLIILIPLISIGFGYFFIKLLKEALENKKNSQN